MLARSAYGRRLGAVGPHGPFEKTRAGGGRRIALLSPPAAEQTPAEVATAGNALTKIIGSLPALENLSLALAMPIDNQGLESLVKAGPSIENLSLRMLEVDDRILARVGRLTGIKELALRSAGKLTLDAGLALLASDSNRSPS